MWGGIIRYREAHSMVRYPSEVDDEFITKSGYDVPPASPASTRTDHADTFISRQSVSWIRGWNFTTDLYRILEHAVDFHRRRWSQGNGTTQVWSLFGPASMPEGVVLDHVLTLYSALPSQFRETLPVTGDPAKDLFGFQSANIQATLQLLRMVLFSAEDRGVEKKCDVAGELLSVFSKVPVEYLKAISSPLVSLPLFSAISRPLFLLRISVLITPAPSPCRDRLYTRVRNGREPLRSILSAGSRSPVSFLVHSHDRASSSY